MRPKGVGVLAGNTPDGVAEACDGCDALAPEASLYEFMSCGGESILNI